MFEHKGVKIQLDEATGFVAPGSYSVSNKNGMVYRAVSTYGESYANNPQHALEGAKKQIDDNVP